jgi:hypothetical protein
MLTISDKGARDDSGQGQLHDERAARRDGLWGIRELGGLAGWSGNGDVLVMLKGGGGGSVRCVVHGRGKLSAVFLTGARIPTGDWLRALVPDFSAFSDPYGDERSPPYNHQD